MTVVVDDDTKRRESYSGEAKAHTYRSILSVTVVVPYLIQQEERKLQCDGGT